MIVWKLKYLSKFGEKNHNINLFYALKPDFVDKYKPLLKKDGLDFTIDNFYKYCYLHNIDFNENDVVDKTKLEGVY